MKELDEFIEFIEDSMEYDPWIRNRNLHGFVEEIVIEGKEAVEAVERKDYGHLKDELGDVLSDFISTCKLAEEQGLFDLKEVIKSALEKLKKRRPYVVEKRKVSMDEAIEIWKKVKEEEKKSERNCNLTR